MPDAGGEAWSRFSLPASEEPMPPAAGPLASGLQDREVVSPFLTPQLAALHSGSPPKPMRSAFEVFVFPCGSKV